MSDGGRTTRRHILALGGTGSALLMANPLVSAEKEKGQKGGEEDVSPAEDLMREHGLLNRILLVYEEGIRRLSGGGGNLHPEALAAAAGIVKRFIEDYHEKLEEEHLFPRFEKAGKLTDLVQVLRAQHQAGRAVTAEVLRLATPRFTTTPDGRHRLKTALERFVRMYRPHEAREDTVLFPALHELVKGKEYDALGERFEDKEHEFFGEGGFEKMVEEVAGLERKLGIYELAQFTPR
jgi:hemerythrin-like domain-containing protein